MSIETLFALFVLINFVQIVVYIQWFIHQKRMNKEILDNWSLSLCYQARALDRDEQ